MRTYYDVTACENCGFVFARHLPTAEQYESYYRANLKYTYEGSRDGAASLFAMHDRSFRMVDEYLARHSPPHRGCESDFFDIGCSTGELLALFQRNGYAHLDGVDPTPECSRIAQKAYGLTIRTAVLSELDPEPHDVVLLANVLEHIPNLRAATQHIASFVADGGLLFVQVPCAEHFGHAMKEPFLEFSIEHLNYFTNTSLANLLGTCGLNAVALEHDVLSYKGAQYPVITSLWQKTNVPSDRSVSDTQSVRTYIERSKERLEELTSTIDEFVDSGEPIIIWGVGSLTARFLATTKLAQANIAGFVDSNSGHHGRTLLGREIAPPSTLIGRSETVFVVSFVYGDEITKTLINELHYTGRVVAI